MPDPSFNDLAFELMDSGEELLERDGYIVMWAPDQDEPETHICVYEQHADYSPGAKEVTLHLEEVYREDADMVERQYWRDQRITPTLDDESSPLSAFSD